MGRCWSIRVLRSCEQYEKGRGVEGKEEMKWEQDWCSKIFVSSFSSQRLLSRGLVVAEAVSALKKTFARILLIVVSSGYGTVI